MEDTTENAFHKKKCVIPYNKNIIGVVLKVWSSDPWRSLKHFQGPLHDQNCPFPVQDRPMGFNCHKPEVMSYLRKAYFKKGSVKVLLKYNDTHVFMYHCSCPWATRAT